MALDDIRQVKLEKLKAMRKAGIDPYPTTTKRSMSVSDALDDFDALADSKKQITLAGRLMAQRGHGGLIFFDIVDDGVKIQGCAKEDALGADEFKFFNELVDIGDIIEVTGTLFKTKKDERTIEATKIGMLTKALLPLPEKWYGLIDVEERFRKRYLDLLMSEEVRGKFIKRAEIIQAIRHYLMKHEFLEVTTPTLQPLYGGASARPFKTHLNALDQDMFLRIAPELYLKRLLVGGLDRVFEFTTNFRNEGIDREHNPEFSAVEFYIAYKDYNWGMDFIEDMMITIAPERFKKPFRRVTYKELMQDTGSLDDAVFKEKVRGTLTEPTFVMDYPKDMLPLTKLKPGTDVVEAFQFYAGGVELVKAFTELNDPIDQRERFKAQENMRAKGDEEAQRLDEDFIEALEYGMPPAAGFGIGIDRLVALLTDSHSLREVILFPTMRPK
ncbi:MAG: amino acid--tRNA ligase-related protein [Patescibacteria group bacterium]